MKQCSIETHICHGRAFFVGDIHGEFHQLTRALDHLGFAPSSGDQLFSVGDLIDRGPDSERCLELLENPWFHAVLGNHEIMMINALSGNEQARKHWYTFGGGWFKQLDDSEQQRIEQRYLAKIQTLPIAMEIQLPNESLTLGMVHADLPTSDWQEFKAMFPELSKEQQADCLWSRDTIKAIERGKRPEALTGIDAVVMGHTPLPMFRGHGRRVWLDTGAGYSNGNLTVLSSQHIVHMLLR